MIIIKGKFYYRFPLKSCSIFNLLTLAALSISTHTHTHSHIYLIAWMLICDQRFHAVLLRQSSSRERKISFFSAWWLSFIRRHESLGHRQASTLLNVYENSCIYLFIYYYYYHIIGLLQILSTLRVIPHLVCHKPTKWESDNQHCYNILTTPIYIYIYISTILIFVLQHIHIFS